MRRRIPAFASVVVVALVAACSSESLQAPTSPELGAPLFAKAPPPPPDISVTTTIFDTDASGNPLLLRSDDYNGTGFATYVSSSGHGSSLTSHINPDGGWQLLLNNQTVRTLALVLASQGMTGIPDGNYWANVEAYARCYDASNTHVDIIGMAAGAWNGNCTFGLDFTAGSTKYKLTMGPDSDADGVTGRALVTCTAASNGSCTNWTVVPNPATVTTFTLTNGQTVSAPVASLYAFTTRGFLFKGSYHNSYSIAATK
jgi:hypothetical protein